MPISQPKALIQDQVLQHLEMVGDITAVIATKEYGTCDLRDQIYILRKRLRAEGRGRWIRTTFHRSPVKNERYAKYTLMTKAGKPYCKLRGGVNVQKSY